MMTKLKLTVNETKTRVAKLPEEKFDFLGYTFGRCYSPKTGRAYLGTTPAKKTMIRICQAISSETDATKSYWNHKTVVTKLNQMMNGWAITSVWGRSAKPIGLWINTPVDGCATWLARQTQNHRRHPSGISR